MPGSPDPSLFCSCYEKVQKIQRLKCAKIWIMLSLYLSNMVNWISTKPLTMFLTTQLQYHLKTDLLIFLFYLHGSHHPPGCQKGGRDAVKSPERPPAKVGTQRTPRLLVCKYASVPVPLLQPGVPSFHKPGWPDRIAGQ